MADLCCYSKRYVSLVLIFWLKRAFDLLALVKWPISKLYRCSQPLTEHQTNKQDLDWNFSPYYFVISAQWILVVKLQQILVLWWHANVPIEINSYLTLKVQKYNKNASKIYKTMLHSQFHLNTVIIFRTTR